MKLMNMRPNRWAQAAACSLVLASVAAFQNCSQAKFTQANQSSSAQDYGGPAAPLSHTGDTAEGTIFSYGSGGNAGGVIVSPPRDFSTSNCTIAYPYASSTAATNVVFNESDVLVAFSPLGSALVKPGLSLNVWYGDEHALILGVRQVVVKTATGSVTTNYDVSAQNGNPGMLINPRVGAQDLTGDQAGTDINACAGVPYLCARPMYPALFITDITSAPTNVSGDWQYGGHPILPHAIFGSWKAAVRTVDKTHTPAVVSVKPDADPARNDLNLGGIPYPAGAPNEGFTSVISWDIGRLGLQSGHSYRLQFIVHDGDQTRTGGDAGQNCVNLQVP